MLRSLDIRDILIIDQLELEFQPGLNVLTGETGAGKSILLDSLGFVLGWRGRAEMVREGSEQGEVIACFDVPADHAVHAVLKEAGFEAEDELMLRRVNTRDGRKSAWVNGRRAPGELLRKLSETLIELHGQHDDRGLLNAKGHRALLDGFADVGVELSACRKAWANLSKAKKDLSETEARLAAAREEEDYLRHAVAELDALDPQEGEEAALDSRRRLMQAADRIRTEIRQASEVLGGQGAEGNLMDAIRWLSDAAGQTEGKLDAPLASLERALAELDGAQRGVQDCLDALSFNDSELEETEERLFAIRGLSRKHDVLPDALGPFADDLRKRLLVLDDGAEHLKAQQRALATAEAEYDVAAVALHEKRKRAAKELDTAMASELAPLKMERAIFETLMAEGSAGPEGRDDIAFSVATNPGAPAGPLNKIASGGELSRFLLALKVCLTKGDIEGLTVIFDEIDRGVGGATADAVGRRLSSLASDGQVLVVTHSPQVAALGAHHWRVEKRQTDTSTLSNVVPLDTDARVDEIARMLSGDVITPEAKAAAKSLMSG